MTQGSDPLGIDGLFEMVQELFSSGVQARRDAAFHFFRDVWQVNRIWRAFHDPANASGEIIGVAELLGVHRNTVTRKMRDLGLLATDFLQATSICELIEASNSLMSQQQALLVMWQEEEESLNGAAQID